MWWSDMKNITQYQVPLTVGSHMYCCPFYALSGNPYLLFQFTHHILTHLLTHAPHTGHIIAGCISSATRATHSSTATTNEFLFSKLACSEQGAAGKFLNEAVKEGMAVIEPRVDLKNVVGKCVRRGGTRDLLLHHRLQHDLLPG